MSNGRHFNPPTPAYRPRDPFSNFVPLSAELVRSCETTKPPPSKPRPIRVDTTSRGADMVEPPPLRKQGTARVEDHGAIAAESKARVSQIEALARETTKVAAELAGPGGESLEEPAPAQKVRANKEQPRPLPAREQTALDKGPAKPESKEPARKAKGKETREPSRAKRPASPRQVAKAASRRSGRRDGAKLVPGEGEEVRVCEWDRCGKAFLVKSNGRAVVRRFCSATCRGRASEARTGKR